MASHAGPAKSLPMAKKPLFKRQAKSLAKSQSTAALDVNPALPKEDQSLDLFNLRSKNFFERLVEEQQATSKTGDKTLGKENIKPAERADPKHQDRKRRKVSPKEDDSDVGDLYGVSEDELERARARKRKSSSGGQNEPLTPPPGTDAGGRPGPKSDKGKGLASLYSLTSPSKRTPGGSLIENPITLSDSDDDQARKRSTRRPHSEAARLDAEVDSDVKILKANLHDEPDRNIRSETKLVTVVEDDDGDGDDSAELALAEDPEIARFVREAQERRDAEMAAVAAHGDMVVQILITSRLGGTGTEPIVVTRRLSQKLGVVRQTALSYSHKRWRTLTMEEEETMFLTWKGRKLFDNATVASLGMIPDEKGVFRASAHSREVNISEGFLEGSLHFEAWTEQTYGEFQRQREKERRRQQGQIVSDDEDGAGDRDGEAGGGDDTAAKIRITLKSRDHEPLKMSARLGTTVEWLVSAFRKQRDIGPEKNVAIFWDGDRLDEDTTLADAEVEDMETLEVHIK